jgi:NAD(P)H-flavin reductase
LELQAPPGFRFAPGQFNMLYAFGAGEVPISISGDPAQRRNLLHTIRAVGDGTRALCRTKRGGLVGVRGPFGTPWPLEVAEGQDLVIVAGGIGLAPLRPVLLAVLHSRAHFGRLALLYGARSARDLLFERDLEAWRGRFDTQVEVTVDSARLDWRGHVGPVTTLIPRAEFDATRTCAFVCGPEIMLRFVVAALRERGVSPERIYVSLERNMRCGIGLCGHCQLGPYFLCKDGPVFSFADVEPWLKHREV